MAKINPKYLDIIKNSEQFDADWYTRRYPDVGHIDMDPAEHFLIYGGLLQRDPGPDFCTAFYMATRPNVESQGLNPLVHALTRRGDNPASVKLVLVAASQLAFRGRYERAIELADANLPDDLKYTAEILRANSAAAGRRWDLWLECVNRYLAKFEAKPLRLTGQGPLFQQFTTDLVPDVPSGPLISVIMPAFNAADTLRAAATSILNQSWRPLELIIVDDASEDATWSVIEEIAASDRRVRTIRNRRNVGPYVSKNVALMQASGAYVTGHDADDWAHPQRLEAHMREVLSADTPCRASLTYMIRMQPSGIFDTFSRINEFTFDGVTRLASISCLLEREFMTKELGFWDSVRFGGDSELISRARKLLGSGFRQFRQIGMLCLSTETGLTNHAQFGIRTAEGRLSPIRQAYKDAWSRWHSEAGTRLYMPFPLDQRPYSVPSGLGVERSDQIATLSIDAAGEPRSNSQRVYNG